jgi:hypothetical protein
MDEGERNNMGKQSSSVYRLLIGASISIFASIPVPSAYAYDCGDYQTDHCYSVFRFGGSDCGTPVYLDCIQGFRTQLDIVKLHGGNGFVDNEMWLANNNGKIGWVEAGYSTNPQDIGLPFYFWGQDEPSTGIFNEGYLGPVADSDFGKGAGLMIQYAGQNHFEVVVDVQGVIRYQLFPQNSMWTEEGRGSIQVGMELAGKSGADSPVAFFAGNSWIDRKKIVHTLTFDAPVQHDNPPYGNWGDWPSQMPGGTFFTICCVTEPTGPTGPPTGPFVSAAFAVKKSITEPVGLPAVKFQKPGSLRVDLEADVRSFAMHSPLPPKIAEASDQRAVSAVNCGMTTEKMSVVLKRKAVGLTPGKGLCYVELTGSFKISGPPNALKRLPQSYSKIFEVFDRKTGNMLMSGAIP